MMNNWKYTARFIFFFIYFLNKINKIKNNFTLIIVAGIIIFLSSERTSFLYLATLVIFITLSE